MTVGAKVHMLTTVSPHGVVALPPVASISEEDRARGAREAALTAERIAALARAVPPPAVAPRPDPEIPDEGVLREELRRAIEQRDGAERAMERLRSAVAETDRNVTEAAARIASLEAARQTVAEEYAGRMRAWARGECERPAPPAPETDEEARQRRDAEHGRAALASALAGLQDDLKRAERHRDAAAADVARAAGAIVTAHREHMARATEHARALVARMEMMVNVLGSAREVQGIPPGRATLRVMPSVPGWYQGADADSERLRVREWLDALTRDAEAALGFPAATAE